MYVGAVRDICPHFKCQWRALSTMKTFSVGNCHRFHLLLLTLYLIAEVLKDDRSQENKSIKIKQINRMSHPKPLSR